MNAWFETYAELIQLIRDEKGREPNGTELAQAFKAALPNNNDPTEAGAAVAEGR